MYGGRRMAVASVAAPARRILWEIQDLNHPQPLRASGIFWCRRFLDKLGGGIFTVNSAVTAPHTGNQSLKTFGGCCSGAFQQFPTAAGESWDGGVWMKNASTDPMAGGQVGAVNIEWIKADGVTQSSIIPFISNGTFTAASPRDIWTLQPIREPRPPTRPLLAS